MLPLKQEPWEIDDTAVETKSPCSVVWEHLQTPYYLFSLGAVYIAIFETKD